MLATAEINKGLPMHCMAAGWAFRPELRMAVLGLLWRREPIVEELLLLVVPSPLQVSCRVESCPGMVMDLAVEGGLKSEGKEVTDCQAGSMHHSVHPTLLSRGKLASSSNGMLGFVFLHSRVMSSLPWATLQEKSSFWGKLRQKGTIHSFIQDNKLRTCTILQDTTQSCPFTPSMCPAGFTKRNQFAVVPLSIPASFLLHLFGQNETFYPSTSVPL